MAEEKRTLVNQLLDMIMAMKGLESDYALAKHLDVPLQTIRNYRKNKSKPDDTMCLQLAEELQMEPMQVMARIRVEGSDNPRILKVWGNYLGRLLLVAGFGIAVSVGTGAAVNQSFAQNQSNHFDHHIHYTHYLTYGA